MNETGERVAVTARAMLGVRFRPQGRDPAYGVDCIGLAARAIGSVMPLPPLPRDYPLRGGSADRIVETVDALGLDHATGAARSGDLLLCEAGPMQFHLAIIVAEGLIHADAGIGRVVLRPGPSPWPVLARWRVPAGGSR